MQSTSTEKRSWVMEFRDFLWLCIVVTAIYWLFSPDKETSLPPVTLTDLKGVWTTSYPGYRDRFLQFDDRAISFGWGEEGTGSFKIENISSTLEKNHVFVQVRYKDLKEDVYQLNFYYLNRNGGLLQIKNQKGAIWLRANDQPEYTPYYK